MTTHGPGNARWNLDGRAVDDLGYVRIRVGTHHPLAQHSSGWAYEHLIVWVSAGRRKPRRGEVLHHRNGLKTDNRLQNLALVSKAVHNREHARWREAAE